MSRTPSCLDCGQQIVSVDAVVDPKRVDVVLRAQCGHEMDKPTAAVLWKAHGYRWDVPAVDAVALIAAERRRQVVDEGHTPEQDAQHTDGLAWAAWSYLDRAVHPSNDPAPPQAWPWETEAWNAHADRTRRLIIAAALIAAEIDRSLIETRSTP